MFRIRFLALALAGVSVFSPVGAATLTEDFSANPMTKGWQVFGDTNSFRWNSTNQNLEVTWDSSRTNSFFYHPLNLVLSRYDDFSIEFDLKLNDIASGVEAGKTGPMQIAIGLMNFAEATATNFLRGVFGGAPDLAEFDYYTSGYYDFDGFIYPAAPATVPSFLSGGASPRYAPTFVDVYDNALPTNQVIHVLLMYAASNQTARLLVTTNGVALTDLPNLVLNKPDNSQFTDADTFLVDTISINSYSSAGDDFDSVLAHGTVNNLVVTTLLEAAPRLSGALTAGGDWQVQFFSRTNWVYTLERTADFQLWTPVGGPAAGINGTLTLPDSSPAGRSFYRVLAAQQ